MNLKNQYKKLSKFNRKTRLRLKRIVLLRVLVTYGFKFLSILFFLTLIVVGIDKLDESPLGCEFKKYIGGDKELKCWEKNNQNSEQSQQKKTVNNDNTSKKPEKHLFEDIESLSILAGLILFVLNIPEQQKRSQYEAWQVINSAKGQKGSGGRIQALQDLNDDNQSLAGLTADDADLTEIDLQGADLSRANLKNTKLDKANFCDTLLFQARLNGATLCDANLTGANLTRADLTNTNLSGAKFNDDRLVNAKLCDAILR